MLTTVLDEGLLGDQKAFANLYRGRTICDPGWQFDVLDTPTREANWPGWKLILAEGGIKVFLFDQHWNPHEALPAGIIRVHDWEEIVEMISS